MKVALIDLAQENYIKPYSIFYDNYLIVLNSKNSFYTFHLSCFERDEQYEKKLNKQRFEKAFVISDILYGVDSCNQAYKFDNITYKWVKQFEELPLFNSEPIYENDKYICYSICYGEFGGLVFFYNKNNRRITLIPANCYTCLMEYDDNYYLITSLSHKDGWSNIICIENPDSLLELPDSLNKYDKWNIIDSYYPILKNNDKDHPIHEVTSQWTKIIMSGLRIDNENYYITNMSYDYNWETYLTKLVEDSLIIIETPDTIFSRILTSNDEITRKVKGQTVFDYPSFIRDSEGKTPGYTKALLNTFIINDTSLIRINWKK